MAHSRARLEWVNCKLNDRPLLPTTIVVYTLSRAVWYDNSTLGHVDWWLWQNISLASTEVIRS